VSALVVLRHSAPRGDSAGPVTTAPVPHPDATPDVVETLTAWFRDHGLETGPMVGISFAVSGSEAAFGTLWPAAATMELPVPAETPLPLDPLPDDVARWIDTVVLTPPPDFGPTNP
jgi:hypothetical protein